MRKIQNNRAWQKLIADVHAELPTGAITELSKRTGIRHQTISRFFSGKLLKTDEQMIMLLKEARKLIKESAMVYKEILKEIENETH
ncbi:MAG: hypothetical protein ACPL2D_10590 [Ignavibacteria bacterium]